MVLGGWGGGEWLRWGSRAPLLFWGDGFYKKKNWKKEKNSRQRIPVPVPAPVLCIITLPRQGPRLGTRYTRVYSSILYITVWNNYYNLILYQFKFVEGKYPSTRRRQNSSCFAFVQLFRKLSTFVPTSR